MCTGRCQFRKPAAGERNQGAENIRGQAPVIFRTSVLPYAQRRLTRHHRHRTAEMGEGLHSTIGKMVQDGPDEEKHAEKIVRLGLSRCPEFCHGGCPLSFPRRGGGHSRSPPGAAAVGRRAARLQPVRRLELHVRHVLRCGALRHQPLRRCQHDDVPHDPRGSPRPGEQEHGTLLACSLWSGSGSAPTRESNAKQPSNGPSIAAPV